MDALQTATSNPAKFFGTESASGSIEQGKIADVVLLSANRWRTSTTREKSKRSSPTAASTIAPALDLLLSQAESAAKPAP
jgi:imidazolonepropionase-like amidohydrolase